LSFEKGRYLIVFYEQASWVIAPNSQNTFFLICLIYKNVFIIYEIVTIKVVIISREMMFPNAQGLFSWKIFVSHHLSLIFITFTVGITISVVIYAQQEARVWLSLVSVRRVRPVHEINWTWWMIFSTERKDKTSVVMIVFRLGWVELNCENFHYEQRFKKRATFWLLLKINCLGIFSVQRFFWENIGLLWQLAFLCYNDIYDCNTWPVLRSEKQTCGHTILK